MSNSKKLDLTKPVQTRDGRKVRVLCADVRHPVYPVCVAVEFSDGAEFVHMYRGDGCHSSGPHALDLMNIPQETVEYVNVYGPGRHGYSYLSTAAANTAAGADRTALIKVTSVDGKVTKVELV